MHRQHGTKGKVVNKKLKGKETARKLLAAKMVKRKERAVKLRFVIFCRTWIFIYTSA